MKEEKSPEFVVFKLAATSQPYNQKKEKNKSILICCNLKTYVGIIETVSQKNQLIELHWSACTDVTVVILLFILFPIIGSL